MVGESRSTRREPTYTRGEHVNSTQKGPSRELNPEPSRCEETVLTTTPPCSPSCWKQLRKKQLGPKKKKFAFQILKSDLILKKKLYLAQNQPFLFMILDHII